jgi:transposase-like protein
VSHGCLLNSTEGHELAFATVATVAFRYGCYVAQWREGDVPIRAASEPASTRPGGSRSSNPGVVAELHAKARRLAPANTLSVREAAERYHIPPSTLARWVRAGMIRTPQKAERRGQATLVVEADVAQLAASYKPGRGRRKVPILLDAIAKSS